jgi:hypothetical protein
MMRAKSFTDANDVTSTVIAKSTQENYGLIEAVEKEKNNSAKTFDKIATMRNEAADRLGRMMKAMK